MFVTFHGVRNCRRTSTRAVPQTHVLEDDGGLVPGAVDTVKMQYIDVHEGPCLVWLCMYSCHHLSSFDPCGFADRYFLIGSIPPFGFSTTSLLYTSSHFSFRACGHHGST